MQARPGIAASQEAHSAADSFDIGSTHRFATSANNTRSTSVVNRREPSALFSASSTPSIRHSPSSRCTVPIGRDSATRSWSPTKCAASAGNPAGPGSPTRVPQLVDIRAGLAGAAVWEVPESGGHTTGRVGPAFTAG